MAYDEATATRVREALGDDPRITDKKMFGGLCFLLNGNMLCGVHSQKVGGGAMFRVGPGNEAEALTLMGAKPMEMTGRRMKGFVDVGAEALDDDAALGRMLGLALAYVGPMQAKDGK